MKILIGIVEFIKTHIVISTVVAIVVVGGTTSAIIFYNLNNNDNSTQIEDNNNQVEEEKTEEQDQGQTNTCEENYILNENGECVEIENEENIEDVEDNSNNQNTTGNTGDNSNNNTQNNSTSNNNNQNTSSENNDNNQNTSSDNSNQDDNSSNNNDNNSDNENEEDLHAGMINLNENVKYKIATLECGEYMYINPVCINKSVGELKTMFPDYNKSFFEYNEDFYPDSYIYTSSRLYGGAHMLVDAFPDCRMDIPVNIQNEIKNLKSKGIIYNVSNEKVEPQWIYFEESKYNDFTDDRSTILGRFGLFDNAACGSGDPILFSDILDEKICEEYNLSCGRW